MTNKKISEEVLNIEEDLINWRRHLHQNAELSFKEFNTSKFIKEKLMSFGNIEVSSPTETSVLGVLKGWKPGKTIAIRADIDALPIQENNDLPFASTNEGVMHACGHDGHAAILLATAKILSGKCEHLAGEVRFIFQHAEETPPGGAVEMMQAGVMKGVDEVYGLHLSSAYETCKFGLKVGPLTSATDRFDIVIKGKGGHSAYPDTTIDPIVIGGEVITAMQTIVARQASALENVVVAICQVSAGSAYNIVPDEFNITGSTRTFSKTIREELPIKMERLVKGITSAYGADYDFKFSLGYSSVINDEALLINVDKVISDTFGKEQVLYIDPVMPGEDFSAFQANCPGVFVDLGTRDESKGYDKSHHNSGYLMDERALIYGVELFVRLTEDRLR